MVLPKSLSPPENNSKDRTDYMAGTVISISVSGEKIVTERLNNLSVITDGKVIVPTFSDYRTRSKTTHCQEESEQYSKTFGRIA